MKAEPLVFTQLRDSPKVSQPSPDADNDMCMIIALQDLGGRVYEIFWESLEN